MNSLRTLLCEDIEIAFELTIIKLQHLLLNFK